MNWFRNLNAMPRLMISFGALMVLLLAISLLAISSLSKSNDRVSALYREDMSGAMQAGNIAVARAINGRSVREAMLHIKEPSVVAENEKTSFVQIDAIGTDLSTLEKTSTAKETKEQLEIVRLALPAYEKGHREIYRQIEMGDLVGAQATLTRVTSDAKPLFDAVARLVEIKQGHAEEEFKASEASFHSARLWMIATCSISLVLSVILALVIARGFSVPLGKAVAALERIAANDLTASLEVDSKDEVGRMAKALNSAVGKLHETMQQVAESAISATSSANQLAAASDAIATGAQEQAASLEETSASLEEISAAVRNSADNARKASELACGSGVGSEHARDTISAVAAMAEISAASAKISEIISTVDEIAFQTNLLAVNAAVEAARAGEEGRGFAVVASEVRSLAQRSSGAAKEIKTLIQDSLRKVERGSELVNRVTQLVSEIAHTSAEQSTGIEQVNTAMTQMDHVTQSNSAQTEELSATAESLSEQAAHLMELIETFTLDRAGKSAREPRPIQSRLASLHRGEATAFAIHPGAGPMAASRQAKRPSRTAVRKSATNAPPLVAAVEHAGSAPVDLNFEEF